MNKKKKRRCSICNELKYDIVTEEDPYVKDMTGKSVKRAMCTDCYNAAVKDV